MKQIIVSTEDIEKISRSYYMVGYSNEEYGTEIIDNILGPRESVTFCKDCIYFKPELVHMVEGQSITEPSACLRMSEFNEKQDKDIYMTVYNRNENDYCSGGCDIKEYGRHYNIRSNLAFMSRLRALKLGLKIKTLEPFIELMMRLNDIQPYLSFKNPTFSMTFRRSGENEDTIKYLYTLGDDMLTAQYDGGGEGFFGVQDVDAMETDIRNRMLCNIPENEM